MLLGRASTRLAPLYDVASLLPYDREPGVKSAMKIGGSWEIAQVSHRDWVAVGARLGISQDEAVARAEELRSRVPGAFHRAAGEDQMPPALRSRASGIADLVTAHVERRRDPWGRVDPTGSSRRL